MIALIEPPLMAVIAEDTKQTNATAFYGIHPRYLCKSGLLKM
jgi:hypothetical protein